MIYSTRYEFASTCGGLGAHEFRIIVSEHFVATDRQFFQELRIGGFPDIHVAVFLLVAFGVVLHGAFKGVGYAYIVNNQSANLVFIYSVYACDCLHQVISAHGFIHIHSGKARHVKTGEPHVYDDYDFERVGVILKALCHLLNMGLIAYDVEPPLGVLIAHGHDNTELALVLPRRSQFAYALIYSHGSGARIRDNHRLAGEFVRTVGLVVLYDVLT